MQTTNILQRYSFYNMSNSITLHSRSYSTPLALWESNRKSWLHFLKFGWSETFSGDACR